MSHAQIIATLGPASSNARILLKMARAGMDVVRLNFSHGTQQEHLHRIHTIRELNRKYRLHIKILGDLEGHRIRVGSLKAGTPVPIRKGQDLWLIPLGHPGQRNSIPFDYAGPFAAIKRGTFIYIDDGTIALKVVHSSLETIKTIVVIPGVIKEHKGINIPGVNLAFRELSQKDTDDIAFCVTHNVDLIAQSFVRNRHDILCLQKELRARSGTLQVIAKIENREGIRNIDAILKESDGIMIARGDMGISIPIYQVPMIQKMIIKKCAAAGKSVITATQMLESMTENHIPTRAEVSDVANAILDGSDYVMLSAETAVGKYPAETVGIMDKIIAYTERSKKTG